MRKVTWIHGLIHTGACLFTLSILLSYVGCSCSPAPPVEEIPQEHTADIDDGGAHKETLPSELQPESRPQPEVAPETPDSPDKTSTPKCTKNEDCGKDEICDQGTCKTNCPPGCPDCKQPDPNNLALGASCERKPDIPNPCDKSKGLDCAPQGQAQSGNPAGTCLHACQADDECTKVRVGLKCLDFTVGTTTIKACALRNKEGDPCNANEQVYCDTGNVCLIGSSDGSGTCIKECSNTAECDKGKICRQAIASNTRTFCLEPVLAGPKCIGDACDFTIRSENCLNGLNCFSGVCVKPCDKGKGDADCDTTRGETCFKRLFSSDPAFCRGKESVTKAGEACNTTNKLCDSSKGLQCISEICAKSCDGAKGEKKNPDCAEIPNAECKQVQLNTGNVTLCQVPAKVNQRCGVDAYCPQGARCIPLTGRPYPTCFVDCDPCKATRNAKGTWTHPSCDGGKTGCTALQYSDGRPAGGICIPRGDAVLKEGDQCTDPNKSCMDDLLCVNFGSAATTVCSKLCDPAKGETNNPDCGGGNCGRLTNGGGVCIPQGQPVLNEGEFCGDDLKKNCKKDLLCLRFSNAEDAKGVCLKKCDPQGNGSECASGSCLGLTNGGGACDLQIKRTQKLGERCRGDKGTPYANECLETDGGKKIVCAPEGDTSASRYCMLACNPGNGAIDNKDCKDAGLNNHICLPDKDRPELGACVEKCTFTNRLRCETSKCQYGSCQQKQLDTQQGQCTTPADETSCKARGGTCVDKTCMVNACL